MATLNDDFDPVKENHPPAQRRRKSVVPKSISTIHNEDPALQPALPRRRKSVAKSASTICHDGHAFQQHPDFKDTPLQRRKSVVPKIAITLHSDDLILKPHELENKQPPTQRRKSVVPKSAFALYAEDPVLQQHEVEVNNQLSRRRKSVVPKAASTLHVDTILQRHESEENRSSLQRKRKSVVSQAASALQPSDPISEKRNEFERELGEYSGNDPLSVWYKYIKWVEQNFIKGGKGGQIENLIERCVSALKVNKHYYNDMRFIEIWLKFASIAKNPVKVYDYMYVEKIGYTSAGFFIAWAGKLEEEGNLKRASEVLQEGIQCKSEPIKKIKSYWIDFKVRVGSYISGDSKHHEGVEDNSSCEKDKIPEKKSTLTPSQVNESKKPTETNIPKTNILKKSFTDANSVPLKTMTSTVPLRNDSHNFRQSCFWDTRLSIMPRVSNALEVQQDCENPPIALFEPPDPLKVPMYCKSKVYAGAQEVSLEEIRAAAWFQKNKTIDYEKRIAEQDKLITELQEKIKSLQQEIELLKENHSKVKHIQSSNVQKEVKILQNSSKKFSTTLHSKSVSKTRNETDLQVQVVNPPATESYDTTKNSKPQPKVDKKNGYIDRELGIILENGEDSYRSSSGSSTSLTQSSQQANVNKNIISSFKKSQKPNEKKIISEKTIESESSPVRETFEAFSTDINPFDEERNENLLSSLNLPPQYYGNIQTSKQPIKVLSEKDLIQIENITYVIESKIAEGSYGKVYAAVKQCAKSKSKVALKVCKQTSLWEIYMCMTLHYRLDLIKDAPDVRSSIMKVTSAHRYSNAIVFTNEFSHRGTLIDYVHFYKRGVPELLTLYITLEMLQIMSKIHECNIIHADVKPDNVLIRDNISKQDILSSLSQKTVLVKFIDFGRAIDLTLFEKGTCFKTALKKDQCIEMIEKKPWVFQIDWFGIINCVHVLLFADYIKVKKQANGRWGIEKKFKRYWDQTIWEPLFDELLNIPTCYVEPNIAPHVSRIETKLKQNIHDFQI